MTSIVNVTATLIADTMGILLLLSIGAGNLWSLKEQSRRNHYLIIIALTNLISCAADMLCAFFDGKPGKLNYVILLTGNTLLYLCGLIIAMAWILLVANYIKVRVSTRRKVIMASFFVLVVALLCTNLFTPVFFRINEYNVYERVGKVYAIYAVSYFGFLLDGVVMYLLKKRESGGLKFFPIWAYVIPVAIGMLIQDSFFGVSTIAPFMAISISTMMFSFQKRLIFKDKLTDLYNRYYLSLLEKKFARTTEREYTVIMLDVNDFKKINDTLGHKVGDEALVNLANILTTEVNQSGEVIRYAGDEFIIILNSHDESAVEALVSRIRQALDRFNQVENTPYEISVAAGWSKFTFNEETIDVFITLADKHMYEDKRRYYSLREQLIDASNQ